ncbi:MAG: CatB-related O-acetyltransferase [Oscillospiraceae bacterium]|jgi:aminocyclitol acetyltransferase|nr:CatB-related O-acetyltransferase [Oscillospiraceae bacterium]
MTTHAQPYVLATFPNGREIVKYGEIADPSPERHYIIIEAPNNGFMVAGELQKLGFRAIHDYWDATASSQWGLTVDWEFGQAKIGKCTFYLSDDFAFAAGIFFTRVGRFTSINDTAMFHHNHQMNMIGTGRFQQLFPFDKQMEYFQRVKQDPALSNPTEKIEIGNDVWIGANVFINVSKCSKIGDGAIIAAGAIVNDDVPPYAIVAGAPARVKKYRYTPEQIETLLRVKWWDWSDEEIAANADELMYPDKFFAKFG